MLKVLCGHWLSGPRHYHLSVGDALTCCKMHSCLSHIMNKYISVLQLFVLGWGWRLGPWILRRDNCNKEWSKKGQAEKDSKKPNTSGVYYDTKQHTTTSLKTYIFTWCPNNVFIFHTGNDKSGSPVYACRFSGCPLRSLIMPEHFHTSQLRPAVSLWGNLTLHWNIMTCWNI